ncbi:MAG: DUF881 domain-containing protein [Nocardioides sp.]
MPDRVRMPLLTLITQQSLDGDYLDAAERRAAGAPRPPRGRPRRVAAVVIAVFGVLVSTAFVQTSRNADVDSASRETLIRRIENQRDRVARQQQRAATLRTRNTSLERSTTRLASEQQAALVRNRRLQVRTGFVGVTGQGLRIVVTEVADADDNQEVQDSDLALLANGLWEAGAEAVAINGQRLTAQSAIRTSGVPIEVNGVGIGPPYTVEAIGDVRTLEAQLFETTTGLAFVGLAGDFGFTYNIDTIDELALPAAPATYLRLRSARIVVPGETTESTPGKEPAP